MYLTAAEAILPAIQRTRRFLFQPFRFSTYLKLCLVALVTEGLGGNGNFTHGHGFHRPHADTESQALTGFTPSWIPIVIAIILVALVVGLVVAYLVTRLRFAYFHCLIHNIREIRPGWDRYRDPATRFFWFNIVVGLCFLLAILVMALPFAGAIWHLVRESHAGAQPGIGAILAVVLPIIPLILLIVIAGFVVDTVLRDFMLPHFALENATAGRAWASVWARIRTQKGQFFIYALLRIVLPIVGAILIFAILVLPAIGFVAAVAIVEVGLHAAFGGAAIVLEVLIGLVSLIVAMVVGICFGGPLSTATREFALIFYGARYPLLGEILFPPPPPPSSMAAPA
jgi:hypothetical protein